MRLAEASAGTELREAEGLQSRPCGTRDLGQVGIVRPVVDRRVEGIVGFGVSPRIAVTHDARHCCVQRVERLTLLGVHRQRCATGTQRLEFRHHIEHAAQIVLVGLGDKRLGVSALVDQAARRQQPQCLAHRGARHGELRGEGGFVERRAGREDALDDATGQLEPDLLGRSAFQHDTPPPRYAGSSMTLT